MAELQWDKLGTAKFQDRISTIKITNPVLVEFLKREKDKDPGDPVKEFDWQVRQLSALECAVVKEKVDESKDKAKLVNAMFSELAKDKIDAIKSLSGVVEFDAAGTPKQLPEDYVRRIYYLAYGSVSPKLRDHQDAIKLAKAFPTEFYTLTNTIIKLTGLGMSLGESKPSGTTTE